MPMGKCHCATKNPSWVHKAATKAEAWFIEAGIVSRIGINFALFEGVEDQEDEADAEDDVPDL